MSCLCARLPEQSNERKVAYETSSVRGACAIKSVSHRWHAATSNRLSSAAALNAVTDAGCTGSRKVNELCERATRKPFCRKAQRGRADRELNSFNFFVIPRGPRPMPGARVQHSDRSKGLKGGAMGCGTPGPRGPGTHKVFGRNFTMGGHPQSFGRKSKRLWKF